MRPTGVRDPRNRSSVRLASLRSSFSLTWALPRVMYIWAERERARGHVAAGAHTSDTWSTTWLRARPSRGASTARRKRLGARPTGARDPRHRSSVRVAGIHKKLSATWPTRRSPCRAAGSAPTAASPSSPASPSAPAPAASSCATAGPSARRSTGRRAATSSSAWPRTSGSLSPRRRRRAGQRNRHA